MFKKKEKFVEYFFNLYVECKIVSLYLTEK